SRIAGCGHRLPQRGVCERRTCRIRIRVVDDKVWQKLGKVAGLHGICWYCYFSLHGPVIVCAFVTGEIEQFVLFDWATNGTAKLVVNQLRFVHVGASVPWPRLQVIVTVIFKG